MDDNVDKSYLQETVHHGIKNAEIGPIIKADAGKGEYAADLAYRGENAANYDALVYEVKSNTPDEKANGMASLIDLTRFIASFNISTASTNAVEQWNQVINVNHFLRQVACEWLGGNWDGIVYSGNNYMLYKHPKTNQFITMPMDFDFTFGNGLELDQRKLMTGKWTDISSRRMVHSYLWEKVMSVPEFQKSYMEMLSTINDKVMHPATLLPRVQGLAYMIQHDAEWDKGLQKWTAGGMSRPWADGSFLESLKRGSGADDENIGLIEWIETKHQAVVQDLSETEALDPPSLEAKLRANALTIKGIPRFVFEKMEDIVGEELGEDIEDLITAQKQIEIMPQAAINPVPQ
ncbi:coth protein-domain-containing protein [Absidia repens]|uniref:Coth protein-domain-containing protein n=1 Tax=Absidia repens TaxID=90262 RepID=A0A1X2I2N2_9FUNG|nr:coth protein-domain-containing protein [Absidia repens]